MPEHTLADQIEEMTGVERAVNLKYQFISPQAGYDRKEFVKRENKHRKLGRYLNSLMGPEGNPEDIGARRDLSRILYGDEHENWHLSVTNAQMLNAGERVYTESLENMARYVKTNFDVMFGKLKTKEVRRVFDSVKLFKNGKRNHDAVVDLRDEIKSMEEMTRTKDIDGMAKYVEQLMQNPKVPNSFKQIIQDMSFQPDIITKTFQDIFLSKQNALDKLVRSNEAVMRKVIKDSIEEAEMQTAKETRDLGDQHDLMTGDVVPVYNAIADTLYPQEDRAVKDQRIEDGDIEQFEMDRRQVERRAHGLSL